MGDGNHRLAGHCFVHGCLNDVLAVTVECAGCFIQQQYRRILENRARDRDALPLSTGQLDAALAHQSLVTVIELHDELVRMCPPSRQLDLFIGRARPAVANVLEKTAMEQARVLWDERNGSSKTLLCDLPNVLVIDADSALDYIVHAQQQAHQCGFAGAARPHEADALPRRDGQLEGFDDVASMPRLVLGGASYAKATRSK